MPPHIRQLHRDRYLQGFDLLLLTQILLLSKLDPTDSLTLIRHLFLHGFDLSLDFCSAFLFVFDLLQVPSAIQNIVKGICSNTPLAARKAGTLTNERGETWPVLVGERAPRWLTVYA